MKFEVRSTYPINVEKLFEYFVFSLDCDKWMEYEDWNGLALLIKDGSFSGFEISNPDPRMEPLALEVETFAKNEKVIYKATKAMDLNVHSEARMFFPITEMKQSLYFNSVESGSQVLHVIEIIPKGIIGWFTCRFILKAQLISGLQKSNNRLRQYLNA